jgi:hypothetical protein
MRTVIVCIILLLLYGPDFIGWLRFAYACSSGCAINGGG